MNKMTSLLAVIACALSTATSAQTLRLNNESGGEIVLTKRTCKVKGQDFSPLLAAYGYSGKGGSLLGCWYIQDDLINVLWFNPNGTTDLSIYPPENFKYIEK